MPSLLPHPSTFNARHLAVPVCLVPVALATDSLLHTFLIALLSGVVVALCSGLSRVLPASTPVRDTAVIVTGASLATCADLLLHAFWYQAYRTMVLIIPMLIASVIANRTWQAGADQPLRWIHVIMAVATVLMVGIAREVVGHGSLLHDTGGGTLTFFVPEMGFFLAALAPGAFIALGIGLALTNWSRQRRT